MPEVTEDARVTEERKWLICLFAPTAIIFRTAKRFAFLSTILIILTCWMPS